MGEVAIHCKYDELVEHKKLKPHPKNRNQHSKEQIDRLVKLIKYQGIRAPVVVSKLSGFIVKGHGTLMAEVKAGVKKIPVVYQEFTSDDQEYAFLQSDNAIASWAELDLSGINADLQDLGPDFDLDQLGIKDFVLEPIEKFEPQADEDEVPEHVEPKTKLGDIYRLGNHRLMCGDSTNIQHVERLMNGEKADMVFTDPPYNLGSHTKHVGKDVNKSVKNLSENSWDSNFDINPALNNLIAVTKGSCSYYIFTSQFLAPDIWKWMSEVLEYYSFIVWCKPNPMPLLIKKTWNFSSTELICYGHGKGLTFNYPESGHAYAFWEFNKKPIKEHPTSKPVELIEHAVKHASNPGYLVLDIFGGSGSTLIACEKTKRKCYMMELDPHYCDVIVARWEKYTGKKAELLTQG